MGNNKAISISKIRKITAIKKNWILNGIRVEFIGSNPHSNGEFFSRSINLFFDKILAKDIVIIAINIIIVIVVNIIKIIYTKNN